MENQDLTIGKSESCDIQVGGRLTGELHARLTVNGETVTIEDLNSQFGTFVNGMRITKPTKLALKDKVKIGTQLLDWEAYREGVEIAEHDPNPVFFKDLFTHRGEISKSNYRFILLFTVVAPLVTFFGVPYLMVLLDRLTGNRFSSIFDRLIEPTWYVLIAMTIYVFLMQSIKRYNTVRSA